MVTSSYLRNANHLSMKITEKMPSGYRRPLTSFHVEVLSHSYSKIIYHCLLAPYINQATQRLGLTCSGHLRTHY
jgi:hypothetical protein